jgi:hypothetical protein
MSRNLSTIIDPLLPLTIDKVSWDDPVLVMSGSDWTLTVMTAWRVSSATHVLFGASDDDAPYRLRDLRGLQVVNVRPQTDRCPLDPAFELSNNHTFEIFSVDSVEPWILRLPEIALLIDARDPDGLRLLGSTAGG